jgi:hypothetical protein
MISDFMVEKKFNCTECAAPLSSAFVQWPRDSDRAAHPSPTLCNKCCPRVLIEALFLTRSGAASAIDALRATGHDVLVADHIVDPGSAETVFIEVYGRFNREDANVEVFVIVPGAAGYPMIDIWGAFWRDVERIVKPFGGEVESSGLIDDNYVPFSEHWWGER